MTDSTINALIVAVPICLAQLYGMYLSHQRGKRQDKKQDVVVAKTETIIEKATEQATATAEIHTLTNSNLSKVTAALEVANAKIEGLQQVVTAMTIKKRKA